MLANVSFGILVLHPVGWALMVAVVVIEAQLLRRAFAAAAATSRYYVVSAVANTVSGAIGFGVSLALNGGWWLVVWVPWVTANEAGSHQWPQLELYMASAYALSVVIESAVAKVMLPHVPLARIAAVQAIVNLITSLALLAVFWSIGGVPGSARE